MNIRIRFSTIAVSAILVITSLTLTSCKTSQNAQSGQRIIKTADGQIVEVALYEMKIHMPTTIPAGNTTFRISNSGKMHSFKIKGNGVEKELERHLKEGESADLVVSLAPGTYDVLCPVLTHPDLGMTLTLTVTP